MAAFHENTRENLSQIDYIMGRGSATRGMAKIIYEAREEEITEKIGAAILLDPESEAPLARIPDDVLEQDLYFKLIDMYIREAFRVGFLYGRASVMTQD